jgi:hypothetical protein
LAPPASGGFAGWLIALKTLLLPGADSRGAIIIIRVPTRSESGGFHHVVVCSTTMFYLEKFGVLEIVSDSVFYSHLALATSSAGFPWSLPRATAQVVGG